MVKVAVAKSILRRGCTTVNFQKRGNALALVALLAGTATAMSLWVPMSALDSVSTLVKGNFGALKTAIKWSSLAAAVGGVVYIVSSHKLVHLKLIEVGEIGFRTRYGQPVRYRSWPWPLAMVLRRRKCGELIVYRPGDKVLYIPIVRGVTIINSRERVDTVSCEGVFMGRNILYDLSIRWQVLADQDSAFRAAFSLYDPIQTDQRVATLGERVVNDVRVLVDRSLDQLHADDSELPRFEMLELYAQDLPISTTDLRPILLPLLDQHGTIICGVQAMNRRFDPEERNKEGLRAIAASLQQQAA